MRTRNSGRLLVIQPESHFDLLTLPVVLDDFDLDDSVGPGVVVIDLGWVAYLDVQDAAVLDDLIRRCGVQGTTVAFVAARPAVDRALRSLGLGAPLVPIEALPVPSAAAIVADLNLVPTAG